MTAAQIRSERLGVGSASLSVISLAHGGAPLLRSMITPPRRAPDVELTGTGRQAAGRIREAIARLEHRALAALDPAAIRGLRLGLDALAEIAP